ncbi:hypothetical protein [Celeribacter marinus]|uniref:hypothetical protein n=1 Tax=Celeribacter marinus TaxID=1397108 RepID=UPI003181F540
MVEIAAHLNEIIAQVFTQCGLPFSTLDEAIEGIDPLIAEAVRDDAIQHITEAMGHAKQGHHLRVMQSANGFVVTMNEAIDLSLDAVGLITEVIMGAVPKGDVP